MSILRPLADRRIATVWGGVVASAAGDEFYNVAVVWLAVGLLGAGAGYLVAGQCVAVMMAALFAGIWVEHWDRRRTMIGVDLLRAAVCMIPVVAASFSHPSVWYLVPVIVVISGAKAIFDPALQASLPHIVSRNGLANDKQLFQATNGLFDATRRIARVSGPGIIAVAGGLIPVMHFFTIDALSFLVSATAIALVLRSAPRPAAAASGGDVRRGEIRRRVRQGITGGFNAVRRHPLMRLALAAHGVGSGAWYLAVILCVAFKVKAELNLDVGAYGMVIAAYGVGNLLATVAVASLRFSQQGVVMFAGRLVAAVGYLGLGTADSVEEMMAWAAVAAAGAPVSNIPFLNILQADFVPDDIARVYRLRMTIEWGSIAGALVLSPVLLEALGTSRVIELAGIAVGLVGVVGMVLAQAHDRSRALQQRATMSGQSR
ncbi:MAG: MFS transporter [Alphaproteobacteria bacterium]|nr:MFS transporter [Alphaproteobacteria bacterium]